MPLAQTALDDMYLVVRPSTGRAGLLASSVRAAIGRVDREQLVSVRDILTLEDVAWDATARQRFRAVLMTSLAALALVLAMVGLFGTLAYAVQRQMRDLAVRRALGATTWDVIRLVANGAAIVLLPGVIIGLTLAAALDACSPPCSSALRPSIPSPSRSSSSSSTSPHSSRWRCQPGVRLASIQSWPCAAINAADELTASSAIS